MIEKCVVVFLPERIFQTFGPDGQGVALIIKRASEMESWGDLRSELYTTFFSGMVWAKSYDVLKSQKFFEAGIFE